MDFLTHPVLFHVGTLNGCEFWELRPHQSQQLLKAECESNTWSANTPKSYLSQRSHPSDFQESVVARSRITIYHFRVILLFFHLVKSVQCAVYCLNDRNMPLSSNKNFSASFFLPAQYPDVGPFNYRYCGGCGSGAGACVRSSCLPACVCARVCWENAARWGAEGTDWDRGETSSLPGRCPFQGTLDTPVLWNAEHPALTGSSPGAPLLMLLPYRQLEGRLRSEYRTVSWHFPFAVLKFSHQPNQYAVLIGWLC